MAAGLVYGLDSKERIWEKESAGIHFSTVLASLRIVPVAQMRMLFGEMDAPTTDATDTSFL